MKNKKLFRKLPLLLMGAFLAFASSCDSKVCSFTDPRDGNVYKSVTIGDQVWMAENLRYLPEVVGAGTGSRTTALYYVYGYNGSDISAAKSTENYATYGVLYNWRAAISACPPGWSLPRRHDWTRLTNYLKDDAGGNLIATGPGLWNDPNIDATNNTGFTALPGGARGLKGTFGGIGERTYWWSSTVSTDNNAYYRDILCIGGSGYLGESSISAELGFSVRCIRYDFSKK